MKGGPKTFMTERLGRVSTSGINLAHAYVPVMAQFAPRELTPSSTVLKQCKPLHVNPFTDRDTCITPV
jgi:hypothetical protein